MKGEFIKPEWVEEKRMPECYVRAQIARQSEDTFEYGPIDLAPTLDNQRSDESTPASCLRKSISPATASTPPTQQSKSSSNKSGADRRASQPFPLSSPEPCLPPLLLSPMMVPDFSDSDSLEEDISELLAKMRSQRRPDSKNSTKAANSSGVSQVSATPRKVVKPTTIVDSKGETPDRPSTMASQPSKLHSPLPGNSKPKPKSGKSVSGLPSASQKNASTESLQPKGKRKAKPLASPGPLEPKVKRSKPNPMQPRKHDKFWHLDGNIIINIENTHFKLHRSRLAEQSQYFTDLFERKDHLTGMDVEEIDGRPVYTVTGVGLKDFEVLLTALDSAM